MLRNIFPLILSMCVASSIAAQAIYLKMDENCMDRLEYSAGNATSGDAMESVIATTWAPRSHAYGRLSSCRRTPGAARLRHPMRGGYL